MKILIFWDIYGRIGRNAFLRELPSLRQKYAPDMIVVNVDNISSGRWPIEKHLRELEKAWVDIMTAWDHVFDNMERLSEYLGKKDSRLIRAANYYETPEFFIPWVGYKVVEKNDKKMLLVHLLSGTSMRDQVYNPFLKLREILSEHKDDIFDAIVVDFHKEYSSEIYGLALWFDGEVSFAYGTHTHIQSNDELILDWWTGVMNDVGMSGSLHSVIWADLGSLKQRFFSGINKGKIEQSLDERYVVNGVYVEIENKKTTFIEKIRIRNKL